MTLCDDWLTTEDVEACMDTADFPESLVESSITAASEWMYDQTGDRWPGECDVTERPCHRRCSPSNHCSCTAEDVLELAYGPIIGVPTVTIDGDGFGAFSVVQPNYLVRTDETAWPSCQAWVDASEGVVVAYKFGATPPELASRAAVALAVELIKSCSGGVCSLPAGTVGLNRRGVSIQLDPAEAGKALPVVALALSAWARSGPADVRVAGKRGLITVGPA